MRLAYLFDRFVKRACSDEERQEFFRLLMQRDNKELLLELINQVEDDALAEMAEEKADEVYDRIRRETKMDQQAPKTILLFHWKKYAAAAAILFFVSAGTYFLFFNKPKQQIVQTNKEPRFKNDVSPATDKAILTLADGKQIVLDDVANGNLTQQGSATVVKLNGQLSYQSGDPSSEIVYNTISTAKGKQYELILADGSKVWLNANTSLRFPTAFTGRERIVELNGEAYFEIAPNKLLPFKVNVANRQIVEVLGTHFTINAYSDEAIIKTTLLEGSVLLSGAKDAKGVKLKPGQQGQLNAAGEIKLVSDADIDHVMAWKNGLFDFDNDNLPDVMRQLSRWYDIEVEYLGKLPVKSLNGQISRKVNLSKVLTMLELTGGVEFGIDGKKIFVKSK